MKVLRKISALAVSVLASTALLASISSVATSACCFWFYQPEVPEALKKYC